MGHVSCKKIVGLCIYKNQVYLWITVNENGNYTVIGNNVNAVCKNEVKSNG